MAVYISASAPAMADNIDNVSSNERRHETVSGLHKSERPQSSSPTEGFQAKCTVPGDVRNSRTLQSCPSADVTPVCAAHSCDRRYASIRQSWYPESTNYYTATTTGYSAHTGSRAQVTWSAASWPEVLQTSDVKPMSFTASLPPSECKANCRQNYCTERYLFVFYIVRFCI